MNPTIYYKNADVNGLNIFYRESGPKDAPTLLLLHGFPTSSHMFRDLIPELNDQYHIIAPDLPGFGFSDAPDSSEFDYTFDNLAQAMQGFIDTLGLKRFALYIFDYGAPTGLRLALANPEKITGIISQNGNAYEEGLSDNWNPIRKYWEDPTPENRQLLSDFTSQKMTLFQYQEGVKDLSLIAPESYTLDQYFLDRPGMNDIQIDLMLDYRTNVALYPKFQEYFRTYQPKLLAAWGKYDPFFLPPGAEGYKKDIPDATVKFYETGHFALETHVEEISKDIRVFLEQLPA
ncbi:hydrolase [Chryseobacterium sp. T16E-39]|uniref:alpha/beta fold hydrolase n=1 Tax=Chryseobacterium sp. T16E-39 TaxID=2015076 RepID=UPI000B5B2622|nr:alpha/beta hydrolase [Chryseobacterium sp. T16E-39]ASK29252.1 hydrolase [Chryseobacterium sp. T16E-39]